MAGVIVLFAATTAAGLDDGVLPVRHVDVLRVVVPGTAGMPPSGMFVQVMEYFQPVFS
jgi:hypothetical protein